MDANKVPWEPRLGASGGDGLERGRWIRHAERAKASGQTRAMCNLPVPTVGSPSVLCNPTNALFSQLKWISASYNLTVSG